MSPSLRCTLAGVAAVILAAAPATQAASSTKHWVTLADVASLVAGKPVRVVCSVPGGGPIGVTDGAGLAIVGEALPGGSVDYLAPAGCIGARIAIQRPYALAPRYVAGSLITLAHEASHSRGFVDETATQCAALRAMPAVLNLIKLPRSLRHAYLVAAAASVRSGPIVYHRYPCSEAPRHP